MKKSGEPYLNKEYVQINYMKCMDVEQDIKDTQEILKKLNQRQAQLGLEQSEFPEAKCLLDALQPFKQLWEVSSDYLEYRGQWWNGKLSQINTQ